MGSQFCAPLFSLHFLYPQIGFGEKIKLPASYWEMEPYFHPRRARVAEATLIQCWASVVDTGPALNQRWQWAAPAGDAAIVKRCRADSGHIGDKQARNIAVSHLSRSPGQLLLIRGVPARLAAATDTDLRRDYCRRVRGVETHRVWISPRMAVLPAIEYWSAHHEYPRRASIPMRDAVLAGSPPPPPGRSRVLRHQLTAEALY